MIGENINIDVSPEVQYVQYSVPDIEFPAQQIIAGTAITSLNGLTGPTITLSGGTTGLSYTPAGVTITLTGTLVAANGGTGNASYTKGDLLAASAATTLSKLAVGTNNARLAADSGQTTGLVWINASTGWNAPTGSLSRGTYAAYAGQTISNPPTQAEVQTLDDAVKLMSQTLAGVITDMRTQKLFNT